MTKPETMRSRASILRESRRLQRKVDGAGGANWPQWGVALLSSMVTLAVAGIGGFVALSGTRFGADEDRAKESREKRAQVYADYLTATRPYLDAESQLTLSFGVSPKRAAFYGPCPPAYDLDEGPDRPRHDDPLTLKRLKRSEAACEALQNQADLMYVYGSDEAWGAHGELKSGVNAMWRAKSDDEAIAAGEAIQQARAHLQAIFCKEVSATPRKGCSTQPIPASPS